MGDQGRSDKHCGSFVLRIFNSLLPSLFIKGSPYEQGRLGRSTSIPSSSSIHTQVPFDFTDLCWEEVLEASSLVPVGVQWVTGCLLPN